MAKKKTRRTKPAPRPKSKRQQYLDWLRGIKDLQSEGRRIILGVYAKLCAGRDSGIWKESGHHSFERFLDKEVGLFPQRWGTLQAAIERYGEGLIEEYGYSVIIPFLRLPEGSPKEKAAFKDLALTKKTHGHVSVETARNIVKKYIPRIVKDRPLTEEERLRQRVRELEGELKKARTLIRTKDKTIRQLKVQLSQYKKSSKKRRAA